MTEWRGIPRDRIPWYPTIDAEACSGCRTCIEFCKNNVLDFDEIKNKAKVVHPFNCVVECSTCGRLCPSEAIHFPEERDFSKILNQLLKDKHSGT